MLPGRDSSGYAEQANEEERAGLSKGIAKLLTYSGGKLVTSECRSSCC
jgi:hypothetical protein